MYSFTLNGKPYKIPESCSELTLGQFIAFTKPGVNELNTLLGCEPDLNSSDPKKIERELTGIYSMISQLAADVEITIHSGIFLVEPKRINVLGLDVEIKPNFVKTLPYWGYVHTKKSVEKRAEAGKDDQFNATDLIPDILAHNLYCLVTKSAYNESKADEFIEVVNTINLIEAMQLGNFFFLQHKSLWSSRRKRLRMTLNLWKLKLVSKFLISTARSTLSKHLAAEI